MENPRPQEIYRHFKGRLYQIITIATDTETGVEMVVYQALYGEYKVYCRPLDMFMSQVDMDKYPDSVQNMRFELVNLENMNSKSEINVEEEEPRRGDTITAHIADPVPSSVMDKTVEEEAIELNMNPKVVAFLDADNARNRLHILGELHSNITDSMIDIMSMAIDTEIRPGDLEQRYDELKDCLTTLSRFEADRLRDN